MPTGFFYQVSRFIAGLCGGTAVEIHVGAGRRECKADRPADSPRSTGNHDCPQYVTGH
jgi:hypothetical protein